MLLDEWVKHIIKLEFSLKPLIKVSTIIKKGS